MTKKSIKLIALLLMAVLFVSSLSQCVFAGDEDAVSMSQSISVKQFNGLSDGTGASKSAQKIIGAIITFVQIIGTGVAIIMLIVLAIKYISAAPGDKADIKKHAVVYVVGAIVLFAASGILGIIQNFASNIS